VTQEDLEMILFDVRTAFLYGELKEKIYMEIPEGVNTEDVCKKENVVCVLNKVMYSLKQAPRCWNSKIKEFLQKFNFKETEADKCIFVGKYKEHTILLAIFVDDGLIAGKSRAILELILKEMSREFDITIRDASLFVGLHQLV